MLVGRAHAIRHGLASAGRSGNQEAEANQAMETAKTIKNQG